MSGDGAQITKYKACVFLDTENMKAQYGIKALFRGKWYQLAKDGEPCLFDTQEERDKALKEWNAELKTKRSNPCPSSAR